MPSITFRFTTECEMTLEGGSYEEIYLRFKDFHHGVQQVQSEARISVCPPESDQVFFALDGDSTLYEIPYFKGSFEADIAKNCEGQSLKVDKTRRGPFISTQVADQIPDVYW
ncbi:hypothetical protein HBA55_30470 [Pseudomaricurvus alkylphenolicus]|jgi:hypothetical protein|uniref:hypothetical protein n=1 Tax=Pseudomaricurvus alkylphenolicus TaxID=1306991 RepID=UPI00142060CC|nr:hypothetical protein [Pseudomaricurvus alkylphenolicus]NIB43966.1 hypothetical protein [Pseudomaricurvus alkylphenolicus]